MKKQTVNKQFKGWAFEVERWGTHKGKWNKFFKRLLSKYNRNYIKSDTKRELKDGD
jgi:hypothetical protein